MMRAAIRTAIFLAAAWSMSLFDCGIAPDLELHGCVPSACLTAAMLAVTLSASGYAFLLAGGFGLAADLAGIGPLGSALACCALVGYLIGRLRGPTQSAGLSRATIELMFGILSVTTMLAVMHSCWQPTNADMPALMHQALGASAYSLALGIPLLVLVIGTRSALRPLTPDTCTCP